MKLPPLFTCDYFFLIFCELLKLCPQLLTLLPDLRAIGGGTKAPFDNPLSCYLGGPGPQASPPAAGPLVPQAASCVRPQHTECPFVWLQRGRQRLEKNASWEALTV